MSAHNVNSKPLKDYLLEVETGKIQIPEFQRDFVWTKTNMIKLITSLLKNYPIGSFLLMNNSRQYAKRLVESCEINSENVTDCDLILDGQQRTTSSYQILFGKGEYKFYFNYKGFSDLIVSEEITDANDIKMESLIEDNIEELIVVYEKNSRKLPSTVADEYVLGYFPLDIILNSHFGLDYTGWLAQYAFNHSKGNSNLFNQISKCNSIFTNKLINNVISYQVNQILVDGNTSPNIICTIFETVNQTGVKLTIIDLLNAKCFPNQFFLSQEIDKVFDDSYTFKSFDNTEKNEVIGITLLKIIGLLKRNSCKKSVLLNLSANDIKESWQKSVQYLEECLIFIKEKFGVISLKYLPYKDMLPVISIIISHEKFDKSNDTHLKKIEKWYWYCVFSSFFDNATETKSTQSVNEFLGTNKEKGWIESDTSIPAIIQNNLNLANSDFNEIDNASSIQSALYKAILNLVILNGAKDFSSDKRPILGVSDKELEDHHIFPKKFLSMQNPSIKGKDANTILNRTLICSDSNQKIKDKQPSIYFKDTDVFSESQFSDEDFAGHFINKEFVDSLYAKGIFSNSNFIEFKKERKRMIIELIKKKIE